jgi:hypothetical protein
MKRAIVSSVETIKEEVLRELVSSSALTSVEATGTKGGFALRVGFGSSTRVLASTRGTLRLFSSLTTLAVLLRSLGISSFTVDATDYAPGRVRPARPDRAEALRRTRTKPQQSELLGARS